MTPKLKALLEWISDNQNSAFFLALSGDQSPSVSVASLFDYLVDQGWATEDEVKDAYNGRQDLNELNSVCSEVGRKIK